jgi:hypothetical protein
MTAAYLILAAVGITTVVMLTRVARFELRSYRARRHALRRQGFLADHQRRTLP